MNENISEFCWPEGFFDSGLKEYESEKRLGDFFHHHGHKFIMPSSFIKGERRLPASSKKCWDNLQNNIGKETFDNFIKSLQAITINFNNVGITKESPGFNNIKKRLNVLYPGETFDEEFICKVLYHLKSLKGFDEWPVIIYNKKLWNDIINSEFENIFRNSKYIARHNFVYALMTKKKQKGLSPSFLDNFKRGMMSFDVYNPELRIRLEFDGSQHDDSIYVNGNYTTWTNISEDDWESLRAYTKIQSTTAFFQNSVDRISDKYFKVRYGIKTIRCTSFSRKGSTENKKEEELNTIITTIVESLKNQEYQKTNTLEKDSRRVCFLMKFIKSYILDKSNIDPNEFYISSEYDNINLSTQNQKIEEYKVSIESAYSKYFPGRTIKINR